MIYTSYFGNPYFRTHSDVVEKCVSIALSCPDTFSNNTFPELYPEWILINQYKNGKITENEYKERYLRLLKQRKLNPEKIAKDLDGKILLCWERKGNFCHRHLVSDWLKPYIIIKEL